MKKLFMFSLMLLGFTSAMAQEENLIEVLPITSMPQGEDVTTTEKLLTIEVVAGEKICGTTFELYVPNVLNLDNSYINKDNSELLPYTSSRGNKTYIHTVQVDKAENQTVDGYTQYNVTVFDMNKTDMSATTGELFSLYVGSIADGTPGVYPIYIKELKALASSDNHKVCESNLVTSYVVYGNVANPTFKAEGDLGSKVLANIPASTTVDFSNVTAVYGTCSNAVNAKYTRTISNQWNTVCLPYTVSSGNGVQYYTVTGVQDDALVVETTATLAAGTPALMKSAEDATSYSADVEGVTLSAVAQNSGSMIGTFEPINVTDADAYYIKSNKFYLCNDNFNVAAFKAYFKTGSSAKSSVLSIEEGNTTSINAANLSENDINEVYGINGVRKNYMQNGVNIVKMSDGKVMKVIVK